MLPETIYSEEEGSLVLRPVNKRYRKMSEPTEMETVPTQAGYDRWAELYDSDDNPLVLLEEQHIGSLIGNVAGLDLADIGCGTGRHALQWAAAGARVTAVDFSEAMLRRAREKPGAEDITFVRHDLTQPLPLAGKGFHRVLCCLVLDHIPDLASFFSELGRLCRPDGFIVVSVVHPAMLLRGVQARFIDPATGRRILPASHPHQISDYLMAAVPAALACDHISEHAVDAALAARSPRSQKYLGWPLLLLMRLVPTSVQDEIKARRILGLSRGPSAPHPHRSDHLSRERT